jgi:hypothetical protein
MERLRTIASTFLVIVSSASRMIPPRSETITSASDGVRRDRVGARLASLDPSP